MKDNKLFFGFGIILIVASISITIICLADSSWQDKAKLCKQRGGTYFWTEKKCLDIKEIDVQ